MNREDNLIGMAGKSDLERLKKRDGAVVTNTRAGVLVSVDGMEFVFAEAMHPRGCVDDQIEDDDEEWCHEDANWELEVVIPEVAELLDERLGAGQWEYEVDHEDTGAFYTVTPCDPDKLLVFSRAGTMEDLA